MKSKIIAVANMKGGVGKTATVVGLAEVLAAELVETLVIDLDPQANASICFAGSSTLRSLIKKGHTIDGFLQDRIFDKKQTDFEDCIRTNVSNVSHMGTQLPVSLLASSSRLRLIERELIYKLTKSGLSLDRIVDLIYNLLKEQLSQTRTSYRYILIDCPPGISVLTEVSLRLADMVIVPTIPDFLSTYGLQSFCSNLWTGEIANETKLKKPKKPHVLITRRRPTREQNLTTTKLYLERRRKPPKFNIFETEVPEMAAIAEALGKVEKVDVDGNIDKPWPTLSQKWKGSAPFLESLAEEVKEILHGA